ncbi:hypothetical protein [Actinomadura sp. HBU206391]|uniref:hypothetical protein n=1 Tax=Actinomadura sp. HBU206391 TaxID=2731692 RepID=UPI001650D1B7|nr:hypothetical protein [Actinomadura sp. HBU206391]MBC6461865.1 hypothetical protein [Actinomadura sp. HBU206391]
MKPIRTSYAWLGARLTTLPERDRKDRGEGPVSYIAVVLLIAIIALAISQTKIGETIMSYISQAVDKVFQNGTKSG